MITSLRIGSSPARWGFSTKLLPAPVGAQSGCAPLAKYQNATLVGWAAGWALTVRHIPEKNTLPAPRPRRTFRRE
jgi:hypothetical protein